MRAASTTISSPSPCVAGPIRSPSAADLLAREEQRRLDAEQHAVPLEPLVRRPPGLEPPHARQRLVQHALEVGELHHAAARVAHRREVPDLRHREEPLVARVVAGHAAVQVHVRHRGQALELEPGQPHHLRAAEHHRVDVPVAPVLLERARRAAEGEVLLARLAGQAAPGVGDHRRGAAQRAGEAGPVDGRAERGGHRVGLRHRSVPPQVEIDRELRLGGDLRREPRQGPGSGGGVGVAGEAATTRMRRPCCAYSVVATGTPSSSRASTCARRGPGSSAGPASRRGGAGAAARRAPSAR